eukprot:2268139-Heterocapsa_arctica.AAC.1
MQYYRRDGVGGPGAQRQRAHGVDLMSKQAHDPGPLLCTVGYCCEYLQSTCDLRAELPGLGNVFYDWEVHGPVARDVASLETGMITRNRPSCVPYGSLVDDSSSRYREVLKQLPASPSTERRSPTYGTGNRPAWHPVGVNPATRAERSDRITATRGHRPGPMGAGIWSTYQCDRTINA